MDVRLLGLAVLLGTAHGLFLLVDGSIIDDLS